MNRIRQAVLSVADKRQVVPFAEGLRQLGVELISTGGTARTLRRAGLKVKEVSALTGFPEILSGRVKTLHPKLMGGILADRASREHLRQIERLGLSSVDLVVVNLYPFEKASRRRAPLKALIEEIDIGGVTLLRAAAKNFGSVGVVSRPEQYPAVLEALRRHGGKLPSAFRKKLAVEAFSQTAHYDALIHQTLAHRLKTGGADGWPARMTLGLSLKQPLRYGENPHQRGAWYTWGDAGPRSGALSGARQLHGKALSFNNLLDLDAALQLAAAFPKPCAVVIKHNNPCGVACGRSLKAAFSRAWACDPVSAFGGIVGFNRLVDGPTALAVATSGFVECVVAPGFRREALEILKRKKNLRLIHLPVSALRAAGRGCLDFKPISGGMLVQSPDRFEVGSFRWRLAAGSRPTAAQRRDLRFAWTVARFVRSNAIVLAQEEATVGIGMGQPSRVESVRIAVRNAGKRARGAVLASDGFFPKPDGPRAAIRAGVRAIVQPGGSIQDPAVLETARRAGVPMLLTGERHFKH